MVGVTTFVLILISAQIMGWWNPIIGSNPESIKGWMTLGYISETYHIPVDEIKKELKLPGTANAETEIRSFESSLPNFSTDLFREYVAKRIGKPYTPSEGSISTEAETLRPEHTPKSTDVPKAALNPSSPISSPQNPESDTKPVRTPAPVKAGASPDTRDPDEIKGMMTLNEVSEGWKIPLTTLIKKLGLPKDVNPNVAIREFDSTYGVGGAKVREVVKTILGK
jgi:hypothetical protein